MKYNCPNCNVLLLQGIEDEHSARADLGCLNCKIFIRRFRETSFNYRLYDDSKGYNTYHISEGTIEYCVKLYKLKAFS